MRMQNEDWPKEVFRWGFVQFPAAAPLHRLARVTEIRWDLIGLVPLVFNARFLSGGFTTEGPACDHDVTE